MDSWAAFTKSSVVLWLALHKMYRERPREENSVDSKYGCKWVSYLLTGKEILDTVPFAHQGCFLRRS